MWKLHYRLGSFIRVVEKFVFSLFGAREKGEGVHRCLIFFQPISPRVSLLCSPYSVKCVDFDFNFDCNIETGLKEKQKKSVEWQENGVLKKEYLMIKIGDQPYHKVLKFTVECFYGHPPPNIMHENCHLLSASILQWRIFLVATETNSNVYRKRGTV